LFHHITKNYGKKMLTLEPGSISNRRSVAGHARPIGHHDVLDSLISSSNHPTQDTTQENEGLSS